MSKRQQLIVFLCSFLMLLGCTENKKNDTKSKQLNDDRELKAKAKQDINHIDEGLKLYFVDNAAEYPNGSGQEILVQLTKDRKNADGSITKSYIFSAKDPWGNLYHYEYPTSKNPNEIPAVWSYGPDQINNDGQGDDINNWSA